MRIIFLGTPDFAVPSLEALAASSHDVVAVVTQPDKPGNRNVLQPCAVKRKAQELGLPILQYERLSRQGADDLRALSPDLMVTCAFGQILSDEILAIAPHGVLNVHGSLLPRYRGASPIQSAVLNGDAQTGVTIMRTVREVDSGDILLQVTTPILPRETAGELFERLAQTGACAIVRAADAIERGEATFTPQDHAQATYCRMLDKESGRIDWTRSAIELTRHIDGMTPWPSAFTHTPQGKLLKIWRADASDDIAAPSGTLVCKGGRVWVACGKGSLELLEVQPEGKKRMRAAEFAAGYGRLDGERLGERT